MLEERILMQAYEQIWHSNCFFCLY
ncbi:LIM domain-containing protein [Enterobacter mori]